MSGHVYSNCSPCEVRSKTHRQLFRTLSRQCASGYPRKSQYILGREIYKIHRNQTKNIELTKRYFDYFICSNGVVFLHCIQTALSKKIIVKTLSYVSFRDSTSERFASIDLYTNSAKIRSITEFHC
jgi:DNA-binding LacI/PurR family transcriptional regulator